MSDTATIERITMTPNFPSGETKASSFTSVKMMVEIPNYRTLAVLNDIEHGIGLTRCDTIDELMAKLEE